MIGLLAKRSNEVKVAAPSIHYQIIWIIAIVCIHAKSLDLMLPRSRGNTIACLINFCWMLTLGFAIFVTVVASRVFGDVLSDVVDPKMKTR